MTLVHLGNAIKHFNSHYSLLCQSNVIAFSLGNHFPQSNLLFPELLQVLLWYPQAFFPVVIICVCMRCVLLIILKHLHCLCSPQKTQETRVCKTTFPAADFGWHFISHVPPFETSCYMDDLRWEVWNRDQMWSRQNKNSIYENEKYDKKIATGIHMRIYVRLVLMLIAGMCNMKENI